ncbi:hypothetical protein K458DRAFT_473754 [Lentithecium fluviatile CBS 122367]|uniref:Uncharacterized protein n=1 Tax=Lentithecium fluviatile CBS 122367 TaxID=1168545 RepID=A0A6G1JQ19_9PLEO|nr:hypothetical protein K458DRAFT_473754 [Lentithecium fluviatile CBS 122367]
MDESQDATPSSKPTHGIAPTICIRDFGSFTPSERSTIVDKAAKVEMMSFPSSEAFDFDAELRKKNTRVMLAVKEGTTAELVGYLVYARKRRLTLLHKIRVHEHERAKGVGKCPMHSLRQLVEKGGFVALFIAVVTAAPQDNFPLNLQFPPVVRVDEPYSFQFAPTAFQRNSDKLQYSHGNRTLWGIPGPNDIGEPSFTIAAAGEAGAVANMESEVSSNVSQQLSKFGQLSGPQSIILQPSKPFEVKFTLDTFRANGKPLKYHATLGDHTPLPAWISFDERSLRFAGTTPPSTSIKSFDIILLDSDTSEYVVASLLFTIQVGVSGLEGKLFLDNATVMDEDIRSAVADLPGWLSFDARSFDISGKPPPGLMSQDLSITVQDRFGNSAEHAIHIAFASRLFVSEIGQLNITLGEPFEYSIPRSGPTHDDETVNMDLGSLTEWLHFDTNALSIHNTIPGSVGASSIESSMTATSGDGTLTDSQTFQLRILKRGTHQNPVNASTDSGANQAGENENASNAHTMSKRKKSGIIIGSVVSDLLAAIILFIFMLFLCRWKKKTKGYISPNTPRRPRKTDVSRPILIPEEWADIDRAHGIDLEKGKADDVSERTPEHPPQIALDLTSKHQGSHSAGSSIADVEDKILTSFRRSSWGFQDEAGPSHHPHDSMKVPTKMLRRESDSSLQKHNGRRSSGLPVSRRLTGLGHGRHAYSPSRSTNNFSSFRRPLSSSTYTTATNSMNMLSTGPSAFPQPPTTRHSMRLTTPVEKRRSIRLVTASTCDSLLDRRTIDEKRSSYIRKRASAQNPSSYKFLPTSIVDSSPILRTPLTPRSTNCVKPSDDVAICGRIGPPREFLRRYAEIPPAPPAHGPADQTSVRPSTAVYTGTGPGHRVSTQYSLLATELKLDLSNLNSELIYNDMDMSASEYSQEDDVIEGYGRRTTIQTGPYVLPPLNINTEKSKHSSKRGSKRDSNHESKRGSKGELKRNIHEHGGRENHSSAYNLNDALPSIGKGKATASPECPKTAIGLRPKHHSRTQSRTTHRRSSAQRNSHGRPLSHVYSTKERHSRKSIHSRTQSRQSITAPARKLSDHSRTQSSAYPKLDTGKSEQRQQHCTEHHAIPAKHQYVTLRMRRQWKHQKLCPP